jgi:hypothetical protein
MAELRFNLGYGYLKLKLDNPVKALIDIRDAGGAFYYDKNDTNIIWAKSLQNYVKINKALKREGYLHPESS